MQEPRQDGYINVLNNFGTQRDSSMAYQYEPEGLIPDMDLTMHYESDGIFARIINYPAEEALKHGYDFEGMDEPTKKLVNGVLDYIDWDESVVTALKWSRLYGGSIIVMLIDDGGNLDEPLNYDAIRDIDELRVFERAIVTPDYTTMYNVGAQAEALKHGRSNFGMPEWYYVFSQFGSFRVHESRCLIFRNGRMPERTSQELYRFWGLPEYLRIRKKMQEADTSASYAVKLLERAVQPVYGMKGLSDLLTTESGEADLLKRLQTIDLGRSLLNSMVIDADGESYEFKVAQLTGVKEVIESTCGMLSAVTGIAQTVLFGSSPDGMNATGESDMDNTYSMVERLQKTQVRRNFEKLMDIILLAAQRHGKLGESNEIPDFSIKFNPLKTVSELDQATIDQTRAATQQIRAATAQSYMDAQVLDPSEVRGKLAEDGEYDVETTLDELTDEELLEMPEGGSPDDNPEPGSPAGQQPEQATGENPQNLLQPKADSGILNIDREGWNTAKNGEHFLVGEGGAIQGGLGGRFNGQKPKSAFEKKETSGAPSANPTPQSPEQSSEAATGQTLTKNTYGGIDEYTTPSGKYIYYPSDIDASLQQITPQQISDAIESMPKRLKDKVGVVNMQDDYNPDDDYWTKEYGIAEGHSAASAGDMEMTFWRNSEYPSIGDSFVRETVAHEAAHSLDVGGKFSSSSEWSAAMKSDMTTSKAKSPTEYGSVHPREDFAESVAAYVTDASEFKRRFPARAKIVEEALND